MISMMLIASINEKKMYHLYNDVCVVFFLSLNSRRRSNLERKKIGIITLERESILKKSHHLKQDLCLEEKRASFLQLDQPKQKGMKVITEYAGHTCVR